MTVFTTSAAIRSIVEFANTPICFDIKSTELASVFTWYSSLMLFSLRCVIRWSGALPTCPDSLRRRSRSSAEREKISGPRPALSSGEGGSPRCLSKPAATEAVRRIECCITRCTFASASTYGCSSPSPVFSMNRAPGVALCAPSSSSRRVAFAAAGGAVASGAAVVVIALLKTAPCCPGSVGGTKFGFLRFSSCSCVAASCSDDSTCRTKFSARRRCSADTRGGASSGWTNSTVGSFSNAMVSQS
mmetsp:Transcript_26266/g.66227  ORF Transcript_26266/g.66227 Transcript_26266/m.66227 type:complete len:245 (-) Transcript_26266:10492-11226(-)